MRSDALFPSRTRRWCKALLMTSAVVGLPVLVGYLSSQAFGHEQRGGHEVRHAVAVRGGDKDRDKQIKLSKHNLKQIGVALHFYHDVHKTFPPWAVCNKAGEPLLSWRVLILPYVEEGKLYNQFKLDEPWDSAHNLKLVEKMPAVYAAPGIKTKDPGLTFYQGFVGKGAGWELMPNAKGSRGADAIRLQDIRDGSSNTIAVIEAAEPVPWTKPADLPFEKGKPLPKIGGVFKGLTNAVMFDGGVISISAKIRPEMLEAAITRSGGEVMVNGWEDGK
jgi:hypothetical protein